MTGVDTEFAVMRNTRRPALQFANSLKPKVMLYTPGKTVSIYVKPEPRLAFERNGSNTDELPLANKTSGERRVGSYRSQPAGVARLGKATFFDAVCDVAWVTKRAPRHSDSNKKMPRRMMGAKRTAAVVDGGCCR